MSEGAAPRPRGGLDYPRTLPEFDEFFPNEESCRDYLSKLRWPKGFVCPACGSQASPWPSGRHLLVCPDCERQTSVTAGTIFAGTRKPLRLWFQAAWEITSRKTGASALGVQQVLGLKSYKTAWAWLHKLRVAMVRPDRDPLSGEIEVDETYLGGDEGLHGGRSAIRKAIVVIAVELRKERPARIRMRHIPNARTDALVGFVTDVAAPGSIIRTDGWRSYKPVARHGFIHKRTELASSSDPAHIVLPHIHRVAALLKRWLLGTHRGAVSHAHLEYYLDEFTFRFNRRTSRARGLLFYRLVSQAARTDPVATAAFYKGTGRGPRKSLRPHR